MYDRFASEMEIIFALMHRAEGVDVFADLYERHVASKSGNSLVEPSTSFRRAARADNG